MSKASMTDDVVLAALRKVAVAVTHPRPRAPPGGPIAAVLIYVCTCVYTYIYIYIYAYRERERERERYSVCVEYKHIHIYIYIYIYTSSPARPHRRGARGGPWRPPASGRPSSAARAARESDRCPAEVGHVSGPNAVVYIYIYIYIYIYDAPGLPTS